MATFPREPARSSLATGLDVLGLIASSPRAVEIGWIGAQLGLPPATARRIVKTLRDHGLVLRVGHGRYLGGPALAGFAENASPQRALAALSRPHARRLAHKEDVVVHVGVFEHNMITYVVRETPASARLFTREGIQLEAYCTAVGKMLLATLPERQRERYLRGGPFVPLTEATIIDPAELRAQLHLAAEREVATEIGETSPGLSCMAVPLRAPDGSVLAAISAASEDHVLAGERLRRALKRTARLIEKALARQPMARPVIPPI